MTYKLTWNPPKHNIKKARYKWDVDHAWLNHEGGYDTDDVRHYSRPWTYLAVKRFIDVPDYFRVSYQQYKNIDKAFTATSEALSEAFREAIEAPIYSYPTVTLRANGETVSSPRSLVDMGDLRDSQSMEILK